MFERSLEKNLRRFSRIFDLRVIELFTLNIKDPLFWRGKFSMCRSRVPRLSLFLALLETFLPKKSKTYWRSYEHANCFAWKLEKFHLNTGLHFFSTKVKNFT